MIVGLNEGLIKQVDKKEYLPLHHAAQCCPETKTLEHLISVHQQGLIVRSIEGHVPLHLLIMHNFRPRSVKYFLDIECAHSMTGLTNNGSKLLHIGINYLSLYSKPFLDYPIDYYASKECFPFKFLRNAQPINPLGVALRNGLHEILECYANSLCKKVGKKQGVRMINDLISESEIEDVVNIFYEYEFDKGLPMIKHLKI